MATKLGQSSLLSFMNKPAFKKLLLYRVQDHSHRCGELELQSFWRAQKGRGQNRGALRAPFALPNYKSCSRLCSLHQVRKSCFVRLFSSTSTNDEETFFLGVDEK